MQNIQKSREMLAQIGAACVQITLGCEHAQKELDSVQFVLSLQELEYALGELHENARILRESEMSRLKVEADVHDGKTEPANEPPVEPVCKCGHPKTDHMPTSWQPEIDRLLEAPWRHAICIRCECEGFEEKND